MCGGITMGHNITEVLRNKGFKVTPQRLAIYKILMDGKDHPTAEMIYEKLQTRYPTMSLATVYKTVEVFKEMGLVHALNVGEDKARYDANVAPHVHMVCGGCGDILDVMDVELHSIKKMAEEKSGYQVAECQIYFHGHCAGCVKKKSN